MFLKSEMLRETNSNPLTNAVAAMIASGTFILYSLRSSIVLSTILLSSSKTFAMAIKSFVFLVTEE